MSEADVALLNFIILLPIADCGIMLDQVRILLYL